MNLVAVSEAAAMLGVSTRQVQRLVRDGELLKAVRGYVDSDSLDRFHAAHGGDHGRAWSEATAWAAISLLDGGDADWLGQTQRSRLRSRLSELDAPALVAKARNRSRRLTYFAHPSVLNAASAAVVGTMAARGRLGLADIAEVDGYVSEAIAARLVARLGLVRDEPGNLTLRVTGMELEAVREIVDHGIVTVALDLAESLDVRERRAGIGALGRALRDFRD